jgi:alkylhydroperoxidase family enzyme
MPVTIEGSSERDAVLGLQAEAFAAYTELLDATAAATDAELLDVCRVRIAQILECREELARHSSERLAEVEAWDRSPAITDRQRAALRFTEQFMFDHSLIDRELVDDLDRALGTPSKVDFSADPAINFGTEGILNFATAIAACQSSMRLSALLDFAPTSSR